MSRFFAPLLAALAPTPAAAAVVPINLQNSVVNVLGASGAGEQGFAAYLSSLHTVGVAAVAAIAVVTIVYGAVLVFGESVWGKKSGKEKIWNAVWGLLLAAGSYVILGTVSQSLLRADFNLSANLGSTAGGTRIGAPSAGGGAVNRPGVAGGTTVLDGFTAPSGDQAESIAAAADYAATHQLNTCSVAGTNGGRRACAYAVNEIVSAATGQAVGGGLSTANMFTALQTSDRFDQISGGFAAARRGDIVISPTNSSGTGHVGIVTQDGGGQIVSNSSSAGAVRANYTGDSWTRSYADTNGVYLFRPNGNGTD